MEIIEINFLSTDMKTWMITDTQYEYESVLTFYTIDYKIADLNFEVIWDNYARKNLADFYFINIAHYHASHYVLSALPLNSKKCKLENILAIAQDEFENGTNYIFITLIRGKPIDGFYLEKFISRIT